MKNLVPFEKTIIATDVTVHDKYADSYALTVLQQLSPQFTVMRCCVAEQRMFRGTNSSVLFHVMLLLGLLMAGVTLGLHFHLQEHQETNEYFLALTLCYLIAF